MTNHFQAKNNVLALDFDGVVIDSIQECLLNGYNAYARFSNGSPVSQFNELPSAWLAEARRRRNFIRNGEDYVFIAHSIHLGERIDDQADFDVFTNRYAALRQSFFDLIYQQRLDFSQQTPHLWGELNPLYDGMGDFLRGYPQKETLFIITSKKLIFVEKILSAHGIELPAANLMDTSRAGKRQLIEEILQARRLPARAFYFIDDQVDTLIKILPTGVNLLLASWGYNNDGQRTAALAHGLPVISLEDFLQQFSR